MQEEKGTTEDEMVGWHHRLEGDEFEQTLGDGEGHPCSSLLSLQGNPWHATVCGHDLASEQ